MNVKEAGYFYILTNPSFREGRVKIGKSAHSVDVRSKELDNTAVPMLFEIFATLKTVKYIEAEKLIRNISKGLTISKATITSFFRSNQKKPLILNRIGSIRGLQSVLPFNTNYSFF